MVGCRTANSPQCLFSRVDQPSGSRIRASSSVSRLVTDTNNDSSGEHVEAEFYPCIMMCIVKYQSGRGRAQRFPGLIPLFDTKKQRLKVK